ncbi:MAG: response regulator [Phycisphaerales bacterium]|nr:response regulator [Phycisphaerales bacterium]MCB9862949.1 response regulator [Phycisphaerales bacterium]
MAHFNAVYEEMKQGRKLPSPSKVALELMRLVDDESSTVEQITRTIEADPAITSNLMKVVNTPFCAPARPVTSVSLAVRLLGIRTVKNLALAFSLLSSDRTSISQRFEFDRFWTESLARATAARRLADHFRACASDEAFTVALLSRIGRLAFATVYPQDYDSLLERQKEPRGRRLLDLEREAFGIDQNELTANMFSDWRIADVFCDAVRGQDDEPIGEDADDSRARRISHLLYLANVIGSVISQPEIYQEDLLEVRRAAINSGMDTESLDEYVNMLNADWPLISSVLSVDGREVPPLRESYGRASREHHRVLVVDDDVAQLRILGKYLSDAGYDVTTATNGLEAYQLIHAEGFQLVLTDWIMPKMDGIALCRAVRESDGAGFVYIIMLTGLEDAASLSSAFEAGADDFLSKSCRKEELLARLKAGVRAAASEVRVAQQRRALHKANAELATVNETLKRMATTDELTGLYNRREAMRRLEECWSMGDRHGQMLTCMMIDVDHFKRCNDTHGHDVGDAVLRAVAKAILCSVRSGEIVFRLGGEEFLVICPEAGVSDARSGAERIRADVEKLAIRHGQELIHMTISVGIAERDDTHTSIDELLKCADEALYRAKRTGRNRVVEYAGECDCHALSGELSPVATPTQAMKPPLDAPKVLVVDDDCATRRLYRRLIERDGFHVFEASDAESGIACAMAQTPNVIVMDLDLPGIDGIECTRRLKADPLLHGSPIIIVTGHQGEDHVKAAMEAGAEELICKPIRHRELVMRVRTMNRLCRHNADLMQSNSVRGEQARAMTTLFATSGLLTGFQSVETISSRVANAAAELLASRRITLLMIDESRSCLTVAATTDGIGADVRGFRVAPGNGVIGNVFASGLPAVCTSPRDSLLPLSPGEKELFDDGPFVVSAIAIDGRSAGVLAVSGRVDHTAYTPADLEYVDLLSSMAASALDRQKASQAREQAHAAIVLGLAKLAEHRDTDTGLHLERVARYASVLCSELRRDHHWAHVIDAKFLDYISNAILLHDIGKVAIPDSVLLKKGGLTDSEFEAMKKHTVIGAAAVAFVMKKAPEAEFLAMARDIARHHHERFDGTGYPDGLARDSIPLAARITTVADVYDALRSRRPYKRAFGHDEAIEIIRSGAGSQFDPVIVEALIRCQGDFEAISENLADEAPGDEATSQDVARSCSNSS